MGFDLGKKLFPRDHPWERRRKLDWLLFGLVFGTALLAGVIYLVISLSGGRVSSVRLEPVDRSQVGK
jgi:hypothetical protein